MCCNGADRKQKRIIAKEDARQATEHVLMALGKPLESVSIFKYLGRLLSSNDDDDWLAGSPWEFVQSLKELGKNFVDTEQGLLCHPPGVRKRYIDIFEYQNYFMGTLSTLETSRETEWVKESSVLCHPLLFLMKDLSQNNKYDHLHHRFGTIPYAYSL